MNLKQYEKDEEDRGWHVVIWSDGLLSTLDLVRFRQRRLLISAPIGWSLHPDTTDGRIVFRHTCGRTLTPGQVLDVGGDLGFRLARRNLQRGA